MTVNLFFAHIDLELVGNLIHYEECFELLLGLLLTACLQLFHLLFNLLAWQPPHQQVAILPLQQGSRMVCNNIYRQVEIGVVEQIPVNLLCHFCSHLLL